MKENEETEKAAENPEVAEQETAEQPMEEAASEAVEEQDELSALKNKVDDLEQQVEKEKKEYLFLMAEFDNFRKRSLKEKSDLIKNGGETAFKNLLPIIDDFERAIDAISKAEEGNESLKEGVELIYNKFVKYLEQGGVKPMETEQGTDFDAELHDAVTMFPAPSEELKGKIIDTVQKGYTINDKVLRHAKVVVGQ